ncbi:uncharacterized protein RHO25_012339 [Cercospora beticola]|uniref:AB hydrolase-1 domain-containing protein n=1 Tax=Cercospora beticola TaxID=122368 RepID=A0ABZ0P752_CERBT|nr:hypothetical protein RHO25_012339 [Cercospora beticola]CAK1356520.1 unnamed protein product [Cercospora beticola]
MSKPTIVVVPGAWHVPEHFNKVRVELETAGYRCVGVELPANTLNPVIDGRLLDISDDLQAVRKAVLAELDTHSTTDVLIVTHSYGSIPGTAALSELSVPARKASGQSNGVAGVVIISGFLLSPGLTMLDAMAGKLPPQYHVENDTTLPFAGPGAIHILYNDLEINEALKAVWRLKPQSYGVLTSKMPDQVAGLKGVPVSYLMCSKDNAVPWAAQEGTVKGLKAAGCQIGSVEVAEAGHSPFLSLPAETARFIRRAAGEEDIKSGFEAFEAA